MNRTKLKNYAPQARRDFIQAMTDRAALYGLTANKIEPVVEKGDVAVIGGRDYPREVAKKRKQLEDRIKRHGFEQTMEALAYTWFNRLVAIRFMELHGYLEHGYRVLSHPEGKPTPEILEHAEHVDLPGLNKEAVIDLKLAGNKEAELYRLLLTAQCNALNTAMPFLFEKIDDETELLLPDNLLHSDSLIRKLVGDIDEEDWQQVEIIGWLYQFYISEKKDEVIGKVVASEDIPAATQLFTPNWIVKYLVQNTLGRQWLATYPQSALRQQMQYYIEPAEQTPEVQEQLKAITPTSLNPEALTLLDPACGSGHILVEAYDLFKAIYQERGYRAKDIPALILQKNLFGLEIDDRAAQLAAFALMMKARADERRIFDSEAKPNILAFQQGLELADLKNVIPEDSPDYKDFAYLHATYHNAKTFGSLIQPVYKPIVLHPHFEKELKSRVLEDLFSSGIATHTMQLLRQHRLLTGQYNAVVANPPYMGPKSMPQALRGFARDNFERCKPDVYAMFIERNIAFAASRGYVGMVTMHNWMFLASFEEFRKHILSSQTIESLAHLGPRAFDSISGEVVNTVAFVVRPFLVSEFRAFFHRLVDLDGLEKSVALKTRSRQIPGPAQHSFELIPGSPLAYWVGDKLRSAFAQATLVDSTISDGQNITANNEKYVRCWWEVSVDKMGRGKKWLAYAKGGEFRRWFGNLEFVVDWSPEARQSYRNDSSARIIPEYLWYRPGITWSRVSGKLSGFRLLPKDTTFDKVGSSVFFKKDEDIQICLGLLNSPVAQSVLSLLNPTLDVQVRDVRNMPILPIPQRDRIEESVTTLTSISEMDWNYLEISAQLQTCEMLAHRESSVQNSYNHALGQKTSRRESTRQLEEENNRLFIEAYGLQDELSPEVPDEQITLYRPDRAEDIKRLLSYAIGCMMGRYTLDKPGLIYAHSGNQGFDPSQYKTFQADDDGIVPLLETDWGVRDDAANRIVEFVNVAWPKEHLEENLKFIADSLGPNNSEQPRDTIRRYLATGFYKHHLSMYKKRPIYWLFSSGKQRAFQCLVYLHRYHEGTLARMRTEYVIPHIARISARLEQLVGTTKKDGEVGEKDGGDIASATSTSQRRTLQKLADTLKKQFSELIAFDERLHHAADQKISLDLDDGVKVNYGKFGDLLAEAKAICGSKEDD